MKAAESPNGFTLGTSDSTMRERDRKGSKSISYNMIVPKADDVLKCALSVYISTHMTFKRNFRGRKFLNYQPG